MNDKNVNPKDKIPVNNYVDICVAYPEPYPYYEVKKTTSSKQNTALSQTEQQQEYQEQQQHLEE